MKRKNAPMFHPLSNYPFARRFLFAPARRRLRIFGEERIPLHGPFIIIANHQSYLDPPMIGIVFIPRARKKIGTITKTAVARAFGRFAGYLGMVGIDPEKPAESLAHCREWIESGKPVLIFPEGTRNYDPSHLTKGKTGAARLALITGVPVIPVGIRVPSGKKTGESIKQFFFTRVPLEMKIGQAIRFERVSEDRISKEILEDTTRTMMQAIAALCGKDYPY